MRVFLCVVRCCFICATVLSKFLFSFTKFESKIELFIFILVKFYFIIILEWCRVVCFRPSIGHFEHMQIFNNQFNFDLFLILKPFSFSSNQNIIVSNKLWINLSKYISFEIFNLLYLLCFTSSHTKNLIFLEQKN